MFYQFPMESSPRIFFMYDVTGENHSYLVDGCVWVRNSFICLGLHPHDHDFSKIPFLAKSDFFSYSLCMTPRLDFTAGSFYLFPCNKTFPTILLLIKSRNNDWGCFLVIHLWYFQGILDYRLLALFPKTRSWTYFSLFYNAAKLLAISWKSSKLAS